LGRFGKYGRKPSWIVKRYGKCRTNDMENMGEKKVE
jgi:hypothetical protein